MQYMLARSFIILVSVIGSTLLVVWPTLGGQHWQLLDDGVTLTIAKAPQETWYGLFSDTGRYRPIYNISYALQYKFFGMDTTGYYRVQAAMLVLSSLLLYAIVQALTDHSGLSCLAALVFVTSSPLAENYYTISKAEPRLVLFLLASLYFYLRADLAWQRRRKLTAHRWLGFMPFIWVMASSISLMCAYLTKETTILLVPASCLFTLCTFLIEYRTGQRPRTAASMGYLGVNLVIGTLFWLAAYVYAPTPAPWTGSYTGARLQLGLTLAPLLTYLRFNFDVIMLASIACAGLCYWLVVSPRLYNPTASYAVFCVLCIGVYLGFFIFVWKWQLSYYLLPVAAWTSIAISLLLKLLIVDRPASRPRMLAFIVFICVLLLSRAYSIPTFYNVAAALRAWDTVNAQIVTWAASLPRNARLLLTYPSDHEYLFELSLLLALLYDRSDIAVSSLANPQAWLSQATIGDMLLVNFSGTANPFIWVRGVNPPPLEHTQREIVSRTGDWQWDEVFRTESTQRHRAPFMLQPRPFVLGWVGYRLSKLPEVWLTKEADGWIGQAADLWITHYTIPVTVVLTGQSFLPPTVAYPIHLMISSNGRRTEHFTVQGPGRFEWRLTLEPLPEARHQSYRHLHIVADKTFVPARDGGGPDIRELSIIIEHVQVHTQGIEHTGDRMPSSSGQ